MKFAILSDIHGNIFALKECFKYIDNMNIDVIIWCGDFITDVPKSHEVIEFIKEKNKIYRNYMVRGNRENYIIDYDISEDKNWTLQHRNGPLLCSYNELNKEDIDFIKELPETCVIDLPNMPRMFVSHKKKLNYGNDCEYKIFGHTHQKETFSIDNIKYINPGSVGLSGSGTIGAEFAVLDIDKDYRKLETYTIKYDINRVIETIQESKLKEVETKWGDVLIKSINTGLDYPAMYIRKVIEIAEEKGLTTDLDDIPMKIWYEARKKLEI